MVASAARTRKCTEPVAPSSGFPTDRRRSGCRSESHQPRALRTRCISDSRVGPARRKAPSSELVANCALFFSHRIELRLTPHALDRGETKGPRAEARQRRAGGSTKAPRSGSVGFAGAGAGKEFAEPGTLSSTFPTNLPLPRSAPRGASSYRRPVLGAGRNLGDGTCPIKGCPTETSRYLHARVLELADRRSALSGDASHHRQRGDSVPVDL